MASAYLVSEWDQITVLTPSKKTKEDGLLLKRSFSSGKMQSSFKTFSVGEYRLKRMVASP